MLVFRGVATSNFKLRVKGIWFLWLRYEWWEWHGCWDRSFEVHETHFCSFAGCLRRLGESNISPFSRNGNPPMKTSTFATLGQSYLPTQPCSSLLFQNNEEILKIYDEMMKDRVTESWELPCFNSFNPWSFANSILFPNPYLRGSGQVSQNWSPDSFSSWDRDVIASEQPNQAANKPLERWENFWVLLRLYIQQFPVFPPTRFATSWNIEGHGMPALCILGVSGDVLLSVEMTDDSPESQVSLRPWLLAKLREQLALTEFQSLLLHSLVKDPEFPEKTPWHSDH